MRFIRRFWLGLLVLSAGVTVAGTPALAQQPQAKPNILFIMGDDIGWMQPSIYHRGLMVGETPNIDRIGNEGAIFMHYYAEQSCTAGRNSFFTGMHPLRTGMIPPQPPGSPSYLRPGTPALAWFLRDLGYNTGEFGKNHLGDHPDALLGWGLVNVREAHALHRIQVVQIAPELVEAVGGRNASVWSPRWFLPNSPVL